MQSFFIIACLIPFAAAVPAYNYQPQNLNTNTFGLPISNNQIASHQGHQFLQDVLQSSQIFSGFSESPSQNHLQQSINSNTQFLAPSNQFQQNQFTHQQNAPIVSKDIFVHVPPPEEPEQNHHAQNAPILPPRKHYRIVFIKAPTEKSSAASLKITQAPIEEKTIIYVLSKKEEPLDLQAVFKDVAPTQPSKPEVYFIKYKTQEEAAHAQQSIQAQYDKLGGTSETINEGVSPITSVIGSLSNQQNIPQSEIQHGPNESLSSYLPPNQ
ncbi:uncharacterized protein LOC129940835 [Eupeodes corollae]|uniref:uncharacterized protein LOC129940835 n=1 Tax=Eupeodes corollae TaxID=290404 RepID=UPI0024919459|nr:uncharacterized protein LOC129940835 [Eupeodes corollae]